MAAVGGAVAETVEDGTAVEQGTVVAVVKAVVVWW